MASKRLSPDSWIEAGFDALVTRGPAALKAEALARDLLARNAGMLQALEGQRNRLNDATRRLKSAPQAIHAYRSNRADDRWAPERKSAVTAAE